MIVRQLNKPQDTLYSLNKVWISEQQLKTAKTIKNAKNNVDLKNAFSAVHLNLIKEVFEYRYSICGGNLRSLLLGNAERALAFGSSGNRGDFSRRFYFLPLPAEEDPSEDGIVHYPNWPTQMTPISELVQLLLRMKEMKKRVKEKLKQLEQIEHPTAQGWSFEDICHMIFTNITRNFIFEFATLDNLKTWKKFSFQFNEPLQLHQFEKIESIGTLSFEKYYKPSSFNHKVIDAFILTKTSISKLSNAENEKPKVLLMQYTIRKEHQVNQGNLEDIVKTISTKMQADDVVWYFVFFVDGRRYKFPGPEQEYIFDILVGQQESQADGQNEALTSQVKLNTYIACRYLRIQAADDYDLVDLPGSRKQARIAQQDAMNEEEQQS